MMFRVVADQGPSVVFFFPEIAVEPFLQMKCNVLLGGLEDGPLVQPEPFVDQAGHTIHGRHRGS